MNLPLQRPRLLPTAAPALPVRAVAPAAPAAAPRRKVADRAVRLTDRDAALLNDMIRLRYCTAVQARVLLSGKQDVSLSAAQARLKRLVRAGLLTVQTASIPREVHAVYLPTRLAYGWLGSDLDPGQRVALGTLLHTLGVVDVLAPVIAARHTVQTDRQIAYEIRALQHARRLPGLPVDCKWTVAGVSHTPDAVVWTDNPGAVIGTLPAAGRPTAIAFEIELTGKPIKKIQEIAVWYRRQNLIGQVIYYTPNRAVRNAVVAAFEAAGAEGMVKVYVYRPTHSTAPPKAATAAA